MDGTLFFGDNPDMRRNHIADRSVDLIYLDPPFNPDASYTAFADSWHRCKASEVALDEVVNSGRSEAANMLLAMKKLLHESDMMGCLAMMSVRLIELPPRLTLQAQAPAPVPGIACATAAATAAPCRDK